MPLLEAATDNTQDGAENAGGAQPSTKRWRITTDNLNGVGDAGLLPSPSTVLITAGAGYNEEAFLFLLRSSGGSTQLKPVKELFAPP